MMGSAPGFCGMPPCQVPQHALDRPTPANRPPLISTTATPRAPSLPRSWPRAGGERRGILVIHTHYTTRWCTGQGGCVLAEYSYPPGFWPKAGCCVAPHGADTRQRTRESLVQSEPSPALDGQLNADHTAHWTPAPTLTPPSEPARDRSRTNVHFRPGQPQCDRVPARSRFLLRTPPPTRRPVRLTTRRDPTTVPVPPWPLRQLG